MNNTSKPCFMETMGQPQEKSALAAAGSTQAPEDIRLPVAATLQHNRGQAYRKVMPEDQENSVVPFFHWGLPAQFEDQKASLTMVDNAKPVIDTGNASFAFLYTKNFAVEYSEFEKNSHFEEQRSCGSGASGEVRAYRDKKNNVPFVRKRIKKGKGLRPEEVKSLIQLSHPGICRLHALLVHGSTVDLLLQDAGFPLRNCLKEFLRKSISAVRYWQVVIDLGRQGFEALKYMHQQGICHLDIKPENLLVNQNSQRNLVLVLADFGSSLALDQVMLPFQMQLTPEYWPPEMWQHVGSFLASLPANQSASVPRSDACQLTPKPAFDTFAMGLVVYFMCTLQHFMQEWERKKDTADTAVPQADIQQVCQRFGSSVGPDFAFKLLLMTDYRHWLQALVKRGDWLFSDFSPPPALLEVMVGTVNPDPENRWTDEQAACCLAGNSPDTTAEGSETESELKPPTQVDDAATDGVEHTDVVDAVVQGPMLAQEPCRLFAVDGNATASNPLERFQKEIAPFLMPWDKNASTAYSSAPQRLGEGVAHSIPTPTSMFLAAPTDIALRPAELSASGTSVFKAGASFAPSQRMPSSDSIVKTRDGQDSVIADHAQTGTGQEVDGVVDLEMKVKVVSMSPGVLDLPAPPDPPADADKGAKVSGLAEGCLPLCSPSAKLGGADSCLAPRCDAAVAHIATDLGALSMQSRAKFAEWQMAPPPRASPGKGGGGRKAPKVGGKAGKHGRAPYKGVARSASMKASSPGKPGAVALHGNKRLLEVPFVVVSSSRPRPSIRTMQGLSGAPAHPAGGAEPVSPDLAASPQWPGALQPVAGVPMQPLKAVQSPCSGTDTDTGWINPWAVVSAGQADSPEMLPAPKHGAPCEHQVFDAAPPQPAEAVVQQPVPDSNQGQAGCGAAQLQPSQADDASIAQLLELLEADQATQGLQGDAPHTFSPAEPLGEQVAEAGPGMTVVEQAVDVGHLMQLGFDLSAQAGPVGQPMQQGLALDQLMQQDFAAPAEVGPVDQLTQQGFAESETGPVNQLMQQGFAVSAEVAPMDQLMQLGIASAETGPVDQLMQQGFAESDQAGSLDQMMTQPGSAASVQVEPVDDQGGCGSVGEALHAASMVDSPVDTQGNVPNFDMLFDL